MKIAFDGKRYFKNHTGLGNYSRNLLRNLSIHFPENEYHILANNTSSSSYELLESNILHDPQKKLGSLWRNSGIIKEIRNIQPEIYHGLSNELPSTIGRSNAKKVVTIHDLFYHHFPKDFTYFDRNIYRRKTIHACKTADHIIAISSSTKNDIVDVLGVNPKKITVIYQSCGDIFQQKSIIENQEFTSKLPSEFALFVGSLNHRKNILGLVNALAILPKEDQIPLIVVGTGSSAFSTLLHKTVVEKKISHLVTFMGSLPNQDLVTLYKKARFTCLLSFYEGFGIPVIESLFTKTPVLVSSVSSLPEAAGKCGIQCDPSDILDISDKLQSLVKDDSRIERLQAFIPSHIKQFSAFSTATKLNSFYFS